MRPVLVRTVFVLIVLFAHALLALPALASQTPAPSTTPILRGVVLDADGEPAANARVELRSFPSIYRRSLDFARGETPEPVAVTRSDRGGRFSITAAGPGIFSVRVEVDGRLSMENGPLPATGGSTTLAPVRLPRDVGSRLRVVDSAERSVEGVQVFAAPVGVRPGADGWQPVPRLERTNGVGEIVFARASFERFTLQVFVPASIAFVTLHDVEASARITLPAPATRSGHLRVRSADGEPAAGVVVFLGEFAWALGETDERGVLALPWPAASPTGPLPLRLLAADGRYLEARLDPALDPARADFTLPAASALEGRVLDAGEGVALPGALTWLSTDPGLFALADEEGRYRLPSPRGGTGGGVGAVRASAAGYRSGTLRLSTFRDSGRRDRVDLPLEPARPGFGRVVDAEDRPIEGALVRVAVAGSRFVGEPSVALTDERGRFAFEQLPAAHVDLEAGRAGYAPTRVRGVEAIEDLGTLVLVPGAAITGRVVDAADAPIPGVGVWLGSRVEHSARGLLDREPDREPLVETDAEGRFAVRDLEPGARAHVLVRADGYSPAVLEAVRAPSRELLFRLERGVVLGGQVLDETGAPIAGAEVSLVPAIEPGSLEMPRIGEEFDRSAITAIDGSFQLETVVPGRYDLDARAAGFAPFEPRVVAVSAEGAVDPDAWHLVLETGAELRGRVTVDGDRPAAGARVGWEGEVALADADGRFVLTGLALGEQVVEASHLVYNGVLHEIEIEEGLNRLDFDLTSGTFVEGRVVDASGEGIADAVIEIARADFAERHRHVLASDADGAFVHDEIAAGRYAVSAWAEGYAFTEWGELVVGEEEIRDLELVLPAASDLVGQVHGLDAEELSRVVVRAESPGVPTIDGAVRFDGSYRVEGLGPGEWTVRASLGGERAASVRLLVEEGDGEQARDLEFGHGFEITGRVVSGGEALGGARVDLVGRDTAIERGVLTDHEGFFSLRDVEAGRYVLSASHARRMLVVSEERVLLGPEEILVEIEAARLRVVVRGADGRPVEGARALLRQVLADGTEGSVYVAAANDRGEVALPSIAAGSYRLRVAKEGYEVARRGLELAPGSTLDETVEIVRAAEPGAR